MPTEPAAADAHAATRNCLALPAEAAPGAAARHRRGREELGQAGDGALAYIGYS